MSTRGTIGIEENGLYRVVYTHCDGYLEHNGLLLYAYYNTKDKVEKLIEHGGMSCLGIRIQNEDGGRHSFDEPTPGTCVFYSRDRGEDIEIREGNEWENKCSKEYDYLFKDNQWFVSVHGNKIVTLKYALQHIHESFAQGQYSYKDMGCYFWREIANMTEFDTLVDALRELYPREEINIPDRDAFKEYISLRNKINNMVRDFASLKKPWSFSEENK